MMINNIIKNSIATVSNVEWITLQKGEEFSKKWHLNFSRSHQINHYLNKLNKNGWSACGWLTTSSLPCHGRLREIDRKMWDTKKKECVCANRWCWNYFITYLLIFGHEDEEKTPVRRNRRKGKKTNKLLNLNKTHRILNIFSIKSSVI